MAKKAKADGVSFGWCADGYHKNCTKTFEKFIFVKKSGKMVVQLLGEHVECNCKCHQPPKIRTRRARTKSSKS